MTWRDFWNADTPIYVSERHKTLHYAAIARDIAALLPSRDAVVLDHGCGEALGAGRVAAGCRTLYLCDGAPLVRQRLSARFASDRRIRVLAPEEADTIPDGALDMVVANSLLQYLSTEEFGDLLGLWRRKLRPGGRLVIGDVIPPEAGPLDDARALLVLAARGGFLFPALAGLVRTALSEYRRLRRDVGLAQYDEAEMFDTLLERGFRPERLPSNIGHNPARMTFAAERTPDE